jgi:uncharacterized protein YndB with AHSA1/START domain
MNPRSATQEQTEHGVVVAPGTLRFERVFPGPVERLWSYLTEPEKLRKWLAAASSAPRAGGNVELTWNHSELSPHTEPTPERFKQHQGAKSRWRVTRYEPPKALSVIWDEGTEGEAKVDFELTPRGDEVLFVLTHKGISAAETLGETAAGWHIHLDILTDNVAGRVPRPFWSTLLAHEAEYAERWRNESSRR